MNEYQVGDYGRFHFKLTCRGVTTGFNLCATVIEFDRKRILLRDNDEIDYLPKKSDIDKFEKSIIENKL
jgi:hypothetical protein